VQANGVIGTQTVGYTNNRNNANTYDAAGNQTGDGLHTYVFNALNQMTSMDGGAATYVYDGEGRRMEKVTSSETTYTFYGPGGIISEFTTSNAIASATGAANSDKCFYHTSDKLGSAVLVMNSAGVVIENNRTLPYGEAWLTTDNGPASTNDKKFTNYQRDQESGLDYAGNRYYASTNGRFASVDAGKMFLTHPTTLNRYLYTWDDPINKIDPSGLDAECVDDGEYGWAECLGGLPYESGEAGGDPEAKADRKTAERFQNAIQKAINGAQKKLAKAGKDCQELFGLFGVSPTQVSALMPTLTYQNGLMSGDNLWAAEGGPVFGTTDALTIQDVFRLGPPPYPSKLTLNGLSTASGVIYFRPSAVNWENIIHEVIHQFSWQPGFTPAQFSDPAILARLVAHYGDDPTKGGIDTSSGATHAISQKIEEKCK
jgi:RHS repeat-associated protein